MAIQVLIVFISIHHAIWGFTRSARTQSTDSTCMQRVEGLRRRRIIGAMTCDVGEHPDSLEMLHEEIDRKWGQLGAAASWLKTHRVAS